MDTSFDVHFALSIMPSEQPKSLSILLFVVIE